MVKSMTGFGKGEATLQNKKITVEIRSLNSKQLDLSLRLPAVYRQSEYELRNVIARTIQRGKVDVFVSVESQAVETPARINREVFREYLRQMNDTLTFAGIDAGYDAILPVIMRLPEVVATESETISEEEHTALIAATEAAAAQLDTFRAQEGAILIADLLRRVELIEQYRDEVVPFEKARTEDGTKIRNFNGIIDLYNFQTGTYDKISDWEIDFASDPALEAQYVNADNQIRVRYRLSEEEKGEEYHENYGYYEAPNLIVKAKEIPPEQYLENLLTEEPNADTEN